VTGDLELKTARGDISIVNGGSDAIQAGVGLLGNIEATGGRGHEGCRQECADKVKNVGDKLKDQGG
jgi:hypothetical protein